MTDISAYSPEVIETAKRVGQDFADGYDRGDAIDFELLENAGLMDIGVCSDTFGQDTLEIGETMWTFNAAGNALLAVILPEST